MSARATAAVAATGFAAESELGARWAMGVRGPLRLEDGRALRIVFPGVPGGMSGPDFRGAILEAGGDLLRGDVELHLRASGWRSHGHHLDDAYARVVLHVAAWNDAGKTATLHAGGRAIPLLILRPAGQGVFPPPFTPPCALAVARGEDPAPALRRLGQRRLRMKAARAAQIAAAAGPGQALYQLLLETLGGSANRVPFAALARQLPLAPLIERGQPGGGRCGGEGKREDEGEGSGARGSPASVSSPPLSRIYAAELKGAAARLVLRRAGLRPMAAPGRRLDGAGELLSWLWPGGASPSWPEALRDPIEKLPGVPGLGRASLIECLGNAVLPVALASEAWTEAETLASWEVLPSPGTYGKLRRLEGWLGGAGAKPFASAGTLQGGLLLHADYCTKGMCGRCPLSR